MRHLEGVVTECRRDVEHVAAPDESRNIGEYDSDVLVAPVDIVALWEDLDPNLSREQIRGTYVTGRPSLSFPKTRPTGPKTS